jgi:IS5 family transposase
MAFRGGSVVNPGGQLHSYVAHLAPEVDRLFIAGHRAARPFATTAAEALRFNGFGALVDFRRPLLHPEGMELRSALALERYLNPAGVEAMLDRHVAAGHLTRRGDRFAATETGRRVLETLSAALIQGLNSLWADRKADVADANVLTSRVVLRGTVILSEDSFPAFYANAADRNAEPGTPFGLWSDLATLRYLRADAHALAWREAGLARTEILCLTELCHRETAVDVSALEEAMTLPRVELAAALSRLRLFGWVDDQGGRWSVTEAGRSSRHDTIERATNAHNAPPYKALTAHERLYLLTILRGIPENSQTS